MAYSTVVDLTFPNAGAAAGWVHYKNNSGADPVTAMSWQDDGTSKFIKSVFDKTSAANRAWWDANHYYPGVGYLNLLAVAYFSPTLGGAAPDLTNARFTWEIRLKNFELPPGARIVQWVQGPDPTQGTGSNVYFNYANFGQAVDAQLGFGGAGGKRSTVDGIENSGWKTAVVNFRPSDADWVCMGSNPERTGLPDDANVDITTRYGCMKSAAAMLATGPTMADTGLLAIFPNEMPGRRPPRQGVNGEIQIRRCKFEKWV